MLSNLSSLTYFMSKLTPESLKRRHGLRLVTSSLSCEASRRLPLISPLQAIVDGDATAADVSRVMTAQENGVTGSIDAASESAGAENIAMQAISKIEPLVVHHKAAAAAPAATSAATTTSSSSSPTSSSSTASASPSPTEIVANSLSAAAAAAATAASSAAGSVYSAAAPIAAPIANNISTFASSATSPFASVASQLQNAAAAGQAGTVATLATVSAAVMSGKTSPGAQQCLSPTEWYVADDEDTHLRYFVIQGSDNMDHWKVNLTFDPVAFEDPSIGVKVHRGVYETAMILYDRFLPLVQDHVASSPSARIAFTGHSLGGSLATLLMMMFLKRGVLRAENLAPVYTFGAPAIFCEGAAGGCGPDGCGACTIPTTAAGSSSSTTSTTTGGSPEGLLKKLGLPIGAVRNVVMHKDIVPRAFACDYSLVADLLRRVGESFREHKCLNGDRRVMFNFVGKMIVLQPDAESSFVAAGEGYHAMLPQKPGMFVVREPTVAESMASQMQREAQMVADVITNLPSTAASALDVPSTGSSSSSHGSTPLIKKIRTTGVAAANAATTTSSSSTATTVKPRPTANSSDEALWQLMNFPHPLDILADPGAYGDSGSISRYHNPDNYTKAIGGVLRARGVAYKTVVKRAKESGVKFMPPSLGGNDCASSPDAAVITSRSGTEHHHHGSSSSGGGKMHSPLAVRRSPSYSS